MSFNSFERVETYLISTLAFLQNSSCVLSNTNSQFMDFPNTVIHNLGDTVTFDAPLKYRVANGLVPTFQPTVQRKFELSVDQSRNISTELTAEQIEFYDAETYMEKRGGKSVTLNLRDEIEANVAKNFETEPYRFFDAVTTPLDSTYQLASALAFFRNYGVPAGKTCGFLSDMSIPRIVNGDLNQFAPLRNDKEAMSWQIGSSSNNCDWFQSNLLPIHIAGTEGNQGSVLTVDSFVVDSTGAVISITFSGTDAAFDPDSVKAYDSFVFNDGVAGVPNIRLMTANGDFVSENPVQFSAAANAASDGSNKVTVTIKEKLQPGTDVNSGVRISGPIQVGMKCTVLPSHRCGNIFAGNPLYFAMPKLPSTKPYESVIHTDMETGISLRMYNGYIITQARYGFIVDCNWGSKLIPEYTMKIALPI